jgi:cytoskeletal protein CcmA (bactofilin family)
VIGSNAQIRAEIAAKTVQIAGRVLGTVTATERVEILEAASLECDVVAPRVKIMDGAHFKGSIEITKLAGQGKHA